MHRRSCAPVIQDQRPNPWVQGCDCQVAVGAKGVTNGTEGEIPSYPVHLAPGELSVVFIIQ